MPTIADARKALPNLAHLDDVNFVKAAQQAYYPNADVNQLGAVWGVNMNPQPVAPTQPTGFLRGAADIGLSLGQGVVGSVKSLTDLAGADNVVSRGLGGMSDFMAEQKSAQSKATLQASQERIKAAEESGSTAEEVKAYMGMLFDQPAEMLAQGIGSFATMGFGKAASALKMAQAAKAAGMSKEAFLASKAGQQAAQEAAKVGMRTNIGIGAAQGVGAVKGSQYEQTYNNAIASGMPEEQARALADEAQSYGGSQSGAMQQALGGVLGAAAAGTGPIERLIAGKKAAESAGGLMARTMKGAATEFATEGAQGGQERYAGNLAAVESGVLPEDQVFRGVFGQGLQEGAIGGVLGGVGGVFDAPSTDVVPNSGPLSRAANAGAAVAPPASQPVPLSEEATKGLLNFANLRFRALEEKASGTKDQTVTGPDGQKVTVPGKPAEFLTPEEKAEREFLAKNGGDAQALAAAYGYTEDQEARALANIEAAAKRDGQAVRDFSKPTESPKVSTEPSIVGKAYKSKKAAEKARLGYGDPTSIEVAQEGDVFVIRPVAGFAQSGGAEDGATDGTVLAGSADAPGLPGDSAVAASGGADGQPAADGGNAGEAVGRAGTGAGADGVRPAQPGATPELSSDLAGAKPRYYIGQNGYELEFDSDIDRAMFIVAKPTPSKRDADYREFLRANGYTDEEIAQGGAEISQRIKQAAKDSAPGVLRIAAKPAEAPVQTPERTQGQAAAAPVQTGDDQDSQYTTAVDLVRASGRASISLVQRHLRIGYNAAAKLIERMEADGIVSPADQQGSRQVLAQAQSPKPEVNTPPIPNTPPIAEANTPTISTPQQQWDTMPPEQRMDVLLNAGWKSRNSESAKAAANQSWDKLGDNKRNKISAAMAATGSQQQAQNATNEDVTQATQAKQGSAGRAQEAAPTTAVQPQAEQAAPAGAGAAPVQADGVKAPDAAGERWTRMTSTEREAVGVRAGLKPEVAKNLSTRGWDRLDPVVREKLAKSVEPSTLQSPSDSQLVNDYLEGKRDTPPTMAEVEIESVVSAINEVQNALSAESAYTGIERNNQIASLGGIKERLKRGEISKAQAIEEFDAIQGASGRWDKKIASATDAELSEEFRAGREQARKRLQEAVESLRRMGRERVKGALPANLEDRITRRIPATDGMEVRVFRTDNGYGTGMYDTDAGQYVNGSITRFTGSDAQEKANARALADLKKATPKGEEQPKDKPTPSANTVFTEDAAAAARARLKAKLNLLNSGIDPETMMDGIILAGYHIEKGARTFAAYAKAMVADLGDAVKPYLKSWYMGVRFDPRATAFAGDMDSAAAVESADVDQVLADETSAAAPAQAPAPATANPSINGPEGRFAVAQSVADHLIGGNKFATIVEARKFIADLTGQKIEPGTRAAKLADETVEMAVVLAARDMIRAGRKQGRSDEVIFERLVSLYELQPSLNVRDSDSIREQAYSTPAPLAFVASRLAGIKPGDKVGEPTAGNSMLLMEVDKADAVLNELNDSRSENLRAMGFTVQQGNAAAKELAPSKSLDAVVMNPPFGVTRDADGKTITYAIAQNYETGEIDHAIVFKALEALKDDGSATLIIGGTLAESEAGRKEAYRGKSKREFFYNLYGSYNVVDHFTVGGDLYKKQGTTYPVDVIVIRGRGKSSRALPAANVPAVVTSWSQLKEKLSEKFDGMVPTGQLPAGINTGGDQPSGVDGGQLLGQPGVQAEGSGQQGNSGRTGAGRGTSVQGGPSGRPTGSGAGRVDAAVGEPGNQARTDGAGGSGPTAGPNTQDGPDGGASASGGGSIGVGRGTDRAPDRARLSGEDAEKLQVSYANFSSNRAVGTLVATNQLAALQDAFDALRKEVGDIDEYVRSELDYSPDDFKKSFSAEQVEALAMAINNISRGKGFIIGDQTGIGKGRVVAAMIRYAKLKGKTPIFVTQMPDLYGDMMRDLTDIQMGGFKPLMTNNNAAVPLDAEALAWFGEKQAINTRITELQEAIADLVAEDLGPKFEGMSAADFAIEVRKQTKASTNPEIVSLRDEIAELKESAPARRGRFLETPSIEQHEANLKQMVEAGNIGGYDAIFTTYDQLSPLDSGKPKTDKDGRPVAKSGPTLAYRNQFLQNFVSKDAMLILDESHNAGRVDPNQRFLTRAEIIRELIGKAGSVFYSSATFAKDPGMMDAYNRTDLGLLGELSMTVPQQQVASAMLVAAGQYIRRERSFDGIEYRSETVNVDKTSTDALATSMSMMVEFDGLKKQALNDIQDELDQEGAVIAALDGGGSTASVESTNFTGVMHNVVNTFLLALKSEAAAQTAIDAIRRGEKPVLTVANTMEMFISDFSEEAGIGIGDRLNATFADVLMRYLEKTRYARIRYPDGTKEKIRLTDAQLGPEAVQAFEDAKEFIASLKLDIPLSPIDLIKQRIQEAGFSIGEVTGRQTVVIDGVRRNRPKVELGTAGKKNTIAKFNNGQLDALIINRSGSTGLSMHASETFNDQRRRVMIIAQAELDINNHMQMLGRTNRTGQVTKAPAVLPPGASTYGLPRYVQLTADVPIELRPAAVLANKMAKLNANTTSARGSAVEDKTALDFMNKYGDAVAAQALLNDPDLSKRLGDPVSIDEESGEVLAKGAMAKVTGRIGLLPLRQQSEVYERLTEEYRALIAQLDATGRNDLEAKTLPLDARRVDSRTLIESNGPSPFQASVEAVVYDVKKLGKPYTSDAVRKMVAESLGGKTAEQLRRQTLSEYDKEMEAQISALQLEAAQKNDPVAVASANKRIDKIRSTATQFRAGLPYIGSSVVLKTDAGNVYGVPVKITKAKGAKSGLALSVWRVTFAVVDGARVMTFPMSQIGSTPKADGSGVVVEAAAYMTIPTEDRTGFQEVEVIDGFDRGQSDSRERRVILTGNILAAMKSRAFPGRIINFVTSEGDVKQGYIIPQNVDLDAAEARLTPELSNPDQMLQFLKAGGVIIDREKVGDALKIERKGIKYVITTSKSGVGRKVSDLGLYMTSVGSRLRGEIYVDNDDADDRLTEFLRRVVQTPGLKIRLTTTSGTKDLLKSLPGPRMSRSFAGRTASVSMRDARAAAGLIRQQMPGAPEIIVLERIEDAPTALLNRIESANARYTVEAAYYDGKIYAFPSNVSDVERFIFVVGRHEVRHAGFRAMLGDQKDATLLSIARANRNLMLQARERQREGLDGSLAESIEEVLADTPVEELAKLTRIKVLVAAVRRWLRDTAVKLRKAGFKKLADAIEPRTWTDNDVLAFVLKAEDVSRGPGGPGGRKDTAMSRASPRYERLVNGIAQGNKTFSKEPVELGRTPSVLRMLGAPDLDLTIRPETILKAMRSESEHGETAHGLSAQVMLALPSVLNEPALVLRSKTQPGSFVVVTELRDGTGQAVVAAIHLSVREGRAEVNRIASSYGRKSSQLQRALDDGDTLYADMKKATDLATTDRLQLPWVVQPNATASQEFKTETDLAQFMATEGTRTSRAWQKNEDNSRIGNTSKERFRRTEALKQAVLDLQEGRITRDEYNAMVDDLRPVFPYEQVPALTTPDQARYALGNGKGSSAKKAQSYGAAMRDLKEGDMAQLRLDIPSFEQNGTWVISVHRPSSTNTSVPSAYVAGQVAGYESAASVTDAYFGMNQNTALKIATGGQSKDTLATVLGKWKPITPEAAKAKAQQVLRDPEWVQVGMDPFRHAYFYDRDTMQPVLRAAEVIQIGPLVLARDPVFGDDKDVMGAPIRFSRAKTPRTAAEAQALVRNTVADFMGDAGAKVGWWDKTIGTQYAKAQRLPEFKRVFDHAQDYIRDTSHLANEAADFARGILPKMDSFADVKKALTDKDNFTISKADQEAVAGPIFTGTLDDKRRYAVDELRDRWKLNERQIAQYNAFMEAVNVSLDQSVAADILRYMGDAATPEFKALAIKDRSALRLSLLTHLANEVRRTDAALKEARRQQRNALSRFYSWQKKKLEGTKPGMRLAIEQEIEDKKAEMTAQTKAAVAKAEKAYNAAVDMEIDVRNKYQRVDTLKDEGYAPLMRFGKYVVHIKDEAGQTLFWSLYESKAAANKAARQFADDAEFAEAEIEQSVLSEKQYELFASTPLDSMELFAKAIDADQSEVFQEFIKVARNNRSVLKRLLKRKGTAGFSEDVPRVLASFITGNARAASASIHLPAAHEAASKIKAGDVKDEAVALLQATQRSGDVSGMVRGLMFTNFIGGSVASAIVNLTQPITMTLPHLAQWGGARKAGRRLMIAGKMAATGKVSDPELAKALNQAETDGVVSPQEIHHLQAQAGGTWGDNRWLKAANFLWAAPFGLAEQFNRRVTFLAAYQTAKESGIDGAYEFAVNTVNETQGLYNKANAANLSRNPIGAVALTFKQFSVHYLEWLGRMYRSGPEGKKAVLLAMSLLILAAGTDGLPFADDFDDLVDTLGQALGYDANFKKARRKFVAETLGLGDVAADVIARGLSAVPGVPMDVSMRMGMSNMLPGSGILLRSNTDTAGQVLEVLGPGGGLAKQYLEAGKKAISGDLAGAALGATPVAIQNAGKGIGMWLTGEARDNLGRKVMDADAVDGLMKFVGFNPQAVARETEKIGMVRRSEQLAKNVEGAIVSDLARAMVDGDAEAQRQARQALADWNEKNPEAPIRITPQQIRQKAIGLRQSREQRFITSAAPERRAQVREAIQ